MKNEPQNVEQGILNFEVVSFTSAVRNSLFNIQYSLLKMSSDLKSTALTRNSKLKTNTMKQYKIIPALLLPILLTTSCGWLGAGKEPGKSEEQKKAAGTCIKGNCTDGEGIWHYNNGRQYEGTFIAGRPGGRGVLTLPSDAEYWGKFKYGQYDGDGDVVFRDGTPALCERGNCINGRGVMRFEDDSVYSGDFKNEIRTGYGGIQFDNGTTFSGEFAKNLYHGKGSLTLPDTTEYRGVFENGLLHGEISITFPTKNKFLGQFEEGKVVEGQGVITFPNSMKGVCLSGNCINGKGTLDFDNGSTYSGNFEKCSRHGKGVYTLASGSRYEGEFEHGTRHGKGSFVFASGLRYEGEYKDGKRHGEGLFIFPNGHIVKVFFDNGKMK